eukprot:CAMPEP_0114600216 /NCGR_PEP_ID=MMETSP0125-20121206/22781_1 /TAXON_ID=485358 ORGANISM="Aristerostoma sp., Strain ATCC 50986" /NCGR_SAMPLE_ID=MMETSP0125 /ASSEMBLY_ACC=CAM_ASM_000245 /LENGTH=153 /DNA_ID=CAMNT_0001808115 /DNA_START=167 /DNA_END=625 /DNA_ORIENTATION=+
MQTADNGSVQFKNVKSNQFLCSQSVQGDVSLKSNQNDPETQWKLTKCKGNATKIAAFAPGGSFINLSGNLNENSVKLALTPKASGTHWEIVTVPGEKDLVQVALAQNVGFHWSIKKNEEDTLTIQAPNGKFLVGNEQNELLLAEKQDNLLSKW